MESGEQLLVSGVRLPRGVVQYIGENVMRLVEKLVEASRIPEWMDKRFAAEVYYAFYVPIPVLSREADSSRLVERAVLQAMIDDIGFWRAKPFTSVDRTASMVAAASFIEALARNLPRYASSSRPGEGGGSDALRAAVAAAMQEARRDASTAKAIKSLIYSSMPGSSTELAFEEVLEAILDLARRTDISRVLERVQGVRVPSRLRSAEARYARGWIEGVEYGGDLERIHYTMLALPDDAFYAFLAESRLLLYRRVLDMRDGPVYVLMDKSGSMAGDKIDWARAVALALLIRSSKERRPFYARFFDASPHALVRVTPSSKPRDVLNVLRYLGRVRAGGGTDITRALVTATDDIQRGRVRGRADIVLITDGEDRLSGHVLSGLLDAARARLHTVMIEGDNPVLESVSDTYMRAEALDEQEMLKVVEAAGGRGEPREVRHRRR